MKIFIKFLGRYLIFKVLLLLIICSQFSCQFKKVENITPILGNPLSLTKNSSYCVKTYNNNNLEISVKNKLENKLKIKGIKINNKCEHIIYIEIIQINAKLIKNIPIYNVYSNEKEEKRNNFYKKYKKEWNKVELVDYHDLNKSTFLYIDVFDKNNFLIDSTNSFVDSTKRNLTRKIKDSKKQEEFNFVKNNSVDYPIISSVNKINRNHILDLDKKILQENISKVKIKKMSSNVSRLETNKKNFEKRCNQNDKNLKFMTLGHLYSYLTNFGYYNLRREYGFGNQEEILFWNSNDNRLVSVYFNEPKHDNVETIYGEYFKEYNTYVYNQNDFKKIKYMCISKDFEEKILGKHIKINDFQINNAFENIKINVL